MFAPEKILQLACQESEIHPKATLVDYYKLFFQGTFGPAHFIKDINSARNFLQQELASATSFEDYFYQNISFQNNYYRVNLSIIKQELVSPEEFFQGFISSTKQTLIITNEYWIKQWYFILNTLKKSSLKIIDFEEASQFIENQFSKQEFAVSHSQKYREAYNPHYRIFNQTEFERLNIEGKLCSSFIF